MTAVFPSPDNGLKLIYNWIPAQNICPTNSLPKLGDNFPCERAGVNFSNSRVPKFARPHCASGGRVRVKKVAISWRKNLLHPSINHGCEYLEMCTVHNVHSELGANRGIKWCPVLESVNLLGHKL